MALKELGTLAKKTPNVAALWLYGSRARNEAHDTSDYDLAVMFECYEEDVVERRLRPETLALEWMQEVRDSLAGEIELSVIDIDLAPVPLAFTVVSDNHLLYTRDELSVIYKEQRIASKWELDYQYHARQYA